jgi:predicted ATPase
LTLRLTCISLESRLKVSTQSSIDSCVHPSESLRLSKKIDRAPGTCQWFLRNDKFVKWRDTMDTPLLWISGSSGAGKSTICSAIVDSLEADRRVGETMAYYFIDRRVKICNPTFGILRTILTKKLSSNASGESRGHLKTLLDDLDAAGEQLSAPQIGDFLLRIMHNISSEETLYLVLDGLDDAEESHSITDPLREIMHMVDRGHGPSHSMKFLISSSLDFFHWKDLQGALHLDIDREISVHNDVAIYFEDNIRDLQLSNPSMEGNIAMTVKEDPWKVQEVVPTRSTTRSLFRGDSAGHQLSPSLTTACDWYCSYLSHMSRKYETLHKVTGTFLWARLLVEVLSTPNQSLNTTHELLEKFITGGCCSIYQYMICRISEKDRPAALQMLRWVVYAARPLKLWELLDAVGSQLNTQFYETDIQRICQGLLRTSDDSTVSLVHSSLWDYLQSQNYKDDILGWGSVSKSSNEMMAHICLQTLNPGLLLESLALSMPRSLPRDLANETSQKLQSYAFRYWKFHYKLAERQSIYLTGLLHGLLRKSFEHRDVHTTPQDQDDKRNLEEHLISDEDESMKDEATTS